MLFNKRRIVSYLSLTLSLLVLGACRQPKVQAAPAVPVQTPKNLIGSMFPAKSFLDMSGNATNIDAFPAVPTFVTVAWSPCPHCQAEKPEWEALYKKYGSKVNIIMIYTDKERAPIEKQVKDMHIPFPVYQFSGNGLLSDLSVSGTPTTFLLSPQHKVIDAVVGQTLWSKVITEAALSQMSAGQVPKALSSLGQ